MKILVLILLLLPCLIYSQPETLKKSSYITHVIIEKNPEIYRKTGVKTQTEWFQNGDNNNSRRKESVKTFDRNGNLIKGIWFRNNGEKAAICKAVYNHAGYITKLSNKEYLHDSLEHYSFQYYMYDSLSRITYMSYYEKSGLINYTVYEYNDILNYFTRTFVDNYSKRSKPQTFYFNKDNYITRYTTNYITRNDYYYFTDSMKLIGYNNDTITQATTSYLDSHKNIIKSVYLNPGYNNGYNLIEYNSKDLPTSSTYKDSTGKENSKLEWQYDENGNIIGESHYENNMLIFRKNYIYNSNGLLLEQTDGNKDIDFSKNKTVYTYEYY